MWLLAHHSLQIDKEKFNNYINEIEPYTDDIIFVKQLLKQILDLNLHSLLNRLAIAVYNGDEYLNLNVKTAKYNIEKGFIENALRLRSGHLQRKNIL